MDRRDRRTGESESSERTLGEPSETWATRGADEDGEERSARSVARGGIEDPDAEESSDVASRSSPSPGRLTEDETGGEGTSSMAFGGEGETRLFGAGTTGEDDPPATDSFADDETAFSLDEPEPLAPRALRLAFRAGRRQGQVLILPPGDYDLGRDPEADVPLGPRRDVRVSASHARVLSDHAGWWIEDLESTNGTLVNGRPLSGPRQLRVGDVVSLGRALRDPQPGFAEFTVSPTSD